MAEAPPVFDDGFNSLMECAVCLHKVTNHRALPCQHLFCQSCLEPLVQRDALSCPVCRKVCKLEARGVAGLPRNLFVMNILEKLCENCAGTNKEIHCPHCDLWLCGACHLECQAQVKDKTHQLNQESKNLLAHGKKTLQVTVEQMTSLYKEASLVSQEINTCSEELIEAIRHRQKQLQDELQEVSAKEMDRLDKQYKDVSGSLDKLEECIEKYSFTDCVPGDIGKMHKASVHWNKQYEGTEKMLQCPIKPTIQYKIHQTDSSHNLLLGEIKITNCTLSTKQNDLPLIDYHSKVVARLVFGHKGSNPGELYGPSHVDVCPKTGNIVVCDSLNSRINIYQQDGQFVSSFGSERNNKGKFNFSGYIYNGGVCVDQDGSVIIADTFNNRLQKFDVHNNFMKVIGCKGEVPGQFNQPCGVSTDYKGNIYICDKGNKRIQVLGPDGKVVRVFGTADIMGDWIPVDIDVCPNGDVVVADWNGKLEVHVFTSNGDHKATHGTGESGSTKLTNPCGVVVDREGNIIMSDTTGHQICVFRQNGEFVCKWGSKGNNPGQFNRPVGVACTRDGCVVVVDSDNNRIQIF